MRETIIMWAYYLDCLLYGGESPTNKYYVTFCTYISTWLGVDLGVPLLKDGSWFNNPGVLFSDTYMPVIGMIILAALFTLVSGLTTGLDIIKCGIRFAMVLFIYLLACGVSFFVPYLGILVVVIAVLAYIAQITISLCKFYIGGKN